MSLGTEHSSDAEPDSRNAFVVTLSPAEVLVRSGGTIVECCVVRD
jgi:hypothetical protein